jgi:UTP--glucose-1-phosphate uridylyltransferase
MQKIRKAIIPVAGAGTRFLPATKAMPKEMLPIIDKPVIQYIVEGAIESGIEDIILVTGASKRAIEDHFDINKELESWLEANNKLEARDQVRQIAEAANFIYIRQKGPYGNGTPVWNARDIIGDEPFVVLFGDDIFINRKGDHVVKQLIDTYNEHGCPVITTMQIDDEGTKKHAVVTGDKLSESVIEVKEIIEKPGPDKTTSRMGAFGNYILTPEIFDILGKQELGKDNELWLTDAIATYIQQGNKVCAKQVEAEYFDSGSKIGWLKANIDFALHRDDMKEEVKEYLRMIND